MTLLLSRKHKIEKPKGALPPPPIEAEDREEPYRPIEWPLLKRCLGMLLPYRKQYIVGVAICSVHVLLEMTAPKFIQHIADQASNYARQLWDFKNGITSVHPDEAAAITHLAKIVTLWACVFAVSVVLQRLFILILNKAGETVQFDFRRKMFAHLQQLSMSYYDKTKLGRIISRCTSDINAMREVNVNGLNTVVIQLLMMSVAAVMLCYTDYRLFLALAPLAPILLLINRIYRKKAASMQQIIREGWTRVATNLAENITGMRIVTAFNRHEPNLATFNSLQVDNTNNNIRNARVIGIYQPSLEIVRFIGRIIILSFGAYLVVNNRFGEGKGVGCVLAAWYYWDWFMNPIINIGNFINTLMAALAGAERVFSLLDTKPDVQDVPAAKPLPRIVGDVTFENVTFGYNLDRPVLHDVNFTAKPGQMVALVGATGSGKSSIISLIARFYQPQKGRVLVDGQDIRYITANSLHKQMGLVLQVNYLFTGTVMENIRYVKPDASEEEVIAAAKAIGSHDAIMTLQNGYHSEVGERGASLSLGQRQLICFTRAFLANPRIFMLDEATSAIDTATELLVQRSLEKLLEGRTTFVVAHRLSTIMRADQILVIEQGKIIERGNHRELLAKGGKYAHLYKQFVLHSD